MPALVSKYEKHVIEVGLKKTYSDLENLIRVSEIDNGSYKQWDYSNQDAFINKYISPYIKLRYCSPHNVKNPSMPYCFAGSDGNYYVWRYPGQKELSIDGGYRISPKYVLNDGRSIMIQVKHTPINSAYWDYVTFVVDVNGQKGKSVMGIDVFQFTLFNYLRYGNSGAKLEGLHPGTIDGGGGEFNYTDTQLSNQCKTGNNLGTHSCGVILQRNGWKFPKDYRIKF